MESCFMQEHERWLAKANEDLDAAKILCRNKSFSFATYHCQQAAEKALKGYLIFKQYEFEKIHDLIKLCALCKNFDSDFQKLANTCESLKPFATKFRYPSEYDIPDRDETRSIIKQTKSVVSFVEKKIAQSPVGQLEIQ